MNFSRDYAAIWSVLLCLGTEKQRPGVSKKI